MFQKIFNEPLDLLPAADDVRARLLGIGLMCAALFFFACLDTVPKWSR